jgi:hypothetical protein
MAVLCLFLCWPLLVQVARMTYMSLIHTDNANRNELEFELINQLNLRLFSLYSPYVFICVQSRRKILRLLTDIMV